MQTYRYCTNEIEYLRKYDRDKANSINKICYDCKMKQKAGKPEDWFRECPDCKDKISYTNFVFSPVSLGLESGLNEFMVINTLPAGNTFRNRLYSYKVGCAF